MAMIDLSTLSDIEIYKLKENGISYWQAINSLADEKTLARQNDIEELKAKYTQDESKRLAETNTPSPGYANLAKLMFQNPYDDEALEIEMQLHNNLIKALNNDRIIALGFDVPRKVNARPVNIPANIIEFKKQTLFNMLSMRTTFQKSSLKVEEVCFVWRHYVDKALSDAINPKLSIPEIKDREARPQGRPSKSEIILTAYEHLDKTGVIDFTKPQKDAIHQIQSYIQNYQPDLYENGKGFGSETIRGYIAEDFSFKAL